MSPRMLPQRVRIERLTRVSDGQRGWVESRILIVAAAACRLGSARLSTFQAQDGQLVSEVQRDAWFKRETDVRVGDVLTLAGQTLELRVESVEIQADGAYRKAKVTDEQPDPGVAVAA